MATSESPEQLHLSFRSAFNRYDVDAVVALYEPGAVLVSVDGPLVGHAAIRAAYLRFFAARPTIDLETLGVNRAGDLAMLHGKWVVRRAGAAGEHTRSEGRNTEIARLQPDGRWLFVIDNPSVP